jgi:class 3 adenylate cyclase
MGVCSHEAPIGQTQRRNSLAVALEPVNQPRSGSLSGPATRTKDAPGEVTAQASRNEELKREGRSRPSAARTTGVIRCRGAKVDPIDTASDIVNTASHMESSGVPGRTQVTEEAYRRLSARFTFVARGMVDIKGKGLMTTYSWSVDDAILRKKTA